MKTEEKTELNHQEWKLAASGAGVIAFTDLDRRGRTMKVLLSMRDPSVGSGYGITGGGFVECQFIDEAPVGSVFETALDAYRETFKEENPGFDALVPYEKFLNEAQPVDTIHVRKDDINRVHGCNFYALNLLENEWSQAKTLPSSSERVGLLIEAELFWSARIDRTDPGSSISLSKVENDGPIWPGQFYHQHEWHAFAMMAWLAQRNRLWTRS